MNKLLISVICFSTVIGSIEGHGRLREPPSRASLWREPEFENLPIEKDWNDNQCFCGGVWVQYGQNNGKCGICGDPWNDPEPRAHETGGVFGNGIVTRQYRTGQVINVAVQLTAAHLGYFEFRLCPHSELHLQTQECLDQYLLPLADGSGVRYPIPTFEAKWYNYSIVLPPGVTCQSCVLQWHYNTGNSHGYCDDGSFELGCGDQETFRGCADISIS